MGHRRTFAGTEEKENTTTKGRERKELKRTRRQAEQGLWSASQRRMYCLRLRCGP